MDLTPLRHVGGHVSLADIDTSSPRGIDKLDAKRDTAELAVELTTLQERFYADGRHKLLIVLQATDTGGKDGTIRRVFGPMNPHGVRVVPFKTPTSTELAHDYLWRVHAQVPALGELVVFNRSHYEDVLIARVHNLVPKERWEKRYDHLVNFEQMLMDEGTTIIKCFLHISNDEQRDRLQARLDDPTKRWKFSVGDLEERKYWDDYRSAYEAMLERTATESAPWWVIPADKKWYRDLVVARIVRDTMAGLDLRYPEGPADPESIKIV